MADEEAGEEGAAVPEVDPIEEKYDALFGPLSEERGEIAAAIEALKENFSNEVTKLSGDGAKLSELQMKSVAARDYYMCAPLPRARRAPCASVPRSTHPHKCRRVMPPPA